MISYETLVAGAFILFVLFWWMNLGVFVSLDRGTFLKWFAVALGAGILGMLGAWGLQSFVSRDWHQTGTALWGAIFAAYLAIYTGLYWILGGEFPRLQRWVDASVPGLCFAHALGRSGCLLVGCCFGVNGFPTIEIEIYFMGLFGLLLQLLWIRKIEMSKPLFCLYLYAYGVLRFVLEFYRGDPGRGSALGLTTSQWGSIFAVLISAIFLDFKWGTRDKSAL